MLQETFVVYDCLKYDIGTIADHNDSIWSSLNGMTREAEYTTLYGTGAIARSVSINGDIIIELDVMTDMYGTGTIFRISNDGTYLSTPSVNDCGLTTNNWKHIKMRIKDNLFSIDDSSISNVDVTGFNQFSIRSAGNYHTYFKNLKIYSI